MEKYGYVDPSRIEFLDEQTMQQPASPNQQASTLQRAGQLGLGLANAAGEGFWNALALPGHVQEATIGKLPGPLNVLSDIKEASVKQAQKLTKGNEEYAKKHLAGDLKPENFATKALQYTASGLPLMLVTGGVTAPKVAADVAGSLGVVAAENFTDNPFAKIGAHILGSRGFSNIAHKINKATSIGSAITKNQGSNVSNLKTDLYQVEKDIGSKIKVTTKPIVDKLEGLKDATKDNARLTIEESRQARSDIDKLLRKLNTPDKTASELYDIKRSVNEFFQRDNLSKGSRSFYKELNSAVKEELNNVGNDKWRNAWKTADELHSLQNWDGGLKNFLKDNLPSGKLQKIADSPLAYGALTTLAGVTKTPLLAAGAGIKYGAIPAARSVKFLNYLSQSDEGRKVLLKITADSARDASSALVKDIKDLNRMAIDYEKNNPEQNEKYGYVDPSQIEFID